MSDNSNEVKSPSNHLINYLRTFNRKERFYLVGMALGNPEFRLAPKFIGDLNVALGTHIPNDAFAAMDYHLDWLFASLVIISDGGGDGMRTISGREITGTQADIDFLIAYAEGAKCHLILVESKGVTSWTNRQMNRKSERFRSIFGEDGMRFPFAVPHFVTVSPKPSARLNTTRWPGWMKPEGKIPWVELDIVPGLRKVTRSDEQGKPNRFGEFWAVRPDRY